MVVIIAGYIFPRYYDSLIPPERRAEGTELTLPGELKGIEGTPLEAGLRGRLGSDAENALDGRSSSDAAKPEVKDNIA
jgi:solute carrier family 6 GABA transporter-like protein 1